MLDAVFYRFGIWGIPLSTSLVNIAGTGALLVLFRRRMGGFELRATVQSFLLVGVASAVLAAVAWWIWHLLDSALGQSLPAQIVSLGLGLVVGYAAFFGVVPVAGRARDGDDLAPAPPGALDPRGLRGETPRTTTQEVEVSVIMTMVMDGDGKKLEQYAAEHADEMRAIRGSRGRARPDRAPLLCV